MEQKQQKKKMQNNFCNLYTIQKLPTFLCRLFLYINKLIYLFTYLIFFKASCAVALDGSIDKILFQ